VEKEDYKGYDTFDGLNSKYLRPFTFNNKLLRIALQQGVRRFPINLRPLVGIQKERSTKAMGFFARAFVRLNGATGDPMWSKKATYALQWLINNQSPGYSGACWGNHFDYQSRSSYSLKGEPSIVWTSLIGHAFLDGYELFDDELFLNVAVSSCSHILRDLGSYKDGDTICIGYFPTSTHQVHNANTLGASLLARTYSHVRNEAFLEHATKAIYYTAKYQRTDGSWYYGEEPKLQWVDNFHTAYVLDSLKHYVDSVGDPKIDDQMMAGYRYWKEVFFQEDGMPNYYNHKTLPIDIQCSSQAIDTLVFFSNRDSDALRLAWKIAQWTVQHMQDRSGYFYYRRYSRHIVNETPTLHWGQATMLCALAGLYRILASRG
jgi:polysaccharide biosynthesis protein VpsJ